jgi:hypothetical protein
VASNFGSKIDSTPKQTKSFKFFAKFTHLDSWVVTPTETISEAFERFNEYTW